MWSFIKCVGKPKYIFPNKSFLLSFRVIHLSLFTKRIYFKIYQDDSLLSDIRESRFIWFITFRYYDINSMSDMNEDSIVKFRVEVGYEV